MEHESNGNLAEFVERIRARDAFAWAEMVDQYEPTLRRITRQYRLSTQETDDAVQITWVRCLEHINQLTCPDRLLSWLATICRRECLRLATRERREALIGESAVMRLIDSNQEEHDPSVEAAHRDDNARLNRAIAALPHRQRTVLLELLGREGCSYLDISRHLGLPVGSIGPTWQRAVTRLRRDPELAELSPAS
ncbi:MAG: sigma-70 family RNA polymerase sigma factor [Trebonia sp.]|jgi:RNA polymerase sigma factor (sigma-70 family)